jgi:hypothetical protein
MKRDWKAVWLFSSPKVAVGATLGVTLFGMGGQTRTA